MVVPYGDPEYYRQRAHIAVPLPGKPEGVVPLDDTFGLHPGLASLKSIYAEGRLGFLHAVGNYNVSRSHFSAQDFVEMGTPGVATTPTGTLSRLVGGVDGTGVTKAIAFASQRPISFLGPEPALVAMDLADFDLSAPGWKEHAERRIRTMYKDAGPLAQVGGEVFEAVNVLRQTPEIKAGPANGAVYPDAIVGNSLRQAAQIIKAGIGTRCIFVHGPGAFDTHSGQVAANNADFPRLGEALAAFDRDLGKAMDDVLVIVTTEFGRTVFVNGSDGTDHGSGYCALILGGRVKGGKIHGRWPGLAKSQLYEERDLAVTTDFRDAFAEVARGHLGIASTVSLFPGHTPAPAQGLLG